MLRRRFRQSWCAAGLAASILAVGCAAPGPVAIRYGLDACEHCRMTIADPRFAAQLVTGTGKVYRFDDPGCLAAFVGADRVSSADVHSVWLNDYAAPDTLVPASDAVLVSSRQIRAPMNGGAAAFASSSNAEVLRRTVGGQLQSWQAYREAAR